MFNYLLGERERVRQANTNARKPAPVCVYACVSVWGMGMGVQRYGIGPTIETANKTIRVFVPNTKKKSRTSLFWRGFKYACLQQPYPHVFTRSGWVVCSGWLVSWFNLVNLCVHGWVGSWNENKTTRTRTTVRHGIGTTFAHLRLNLSSKEKLVIKSVNNCSLEAREDDLHTPTKERSLKVEKKFTMV